MSNKLEYLDDGSLQELFANDTQNEITIVDVRNPGEHAAEYIDGSINLPVDELLTADKNQFKDKVVVFHCKGGIRTRANQHLLEAFSTKRTLCMEGGIDQWINLGKPIKRS